VIVRFLELDVHRGQDGGAATAPDCGATRFFHVRRAARDALGLADTLFAARGDVVFVSPSDALEFAERYNRVHGLSGAGALRAAEAFAMGLVHEILHALVATYRRRFGRDRWDALTAKLQQDLGPAYDDTLQSLVGEMPPPSVYRNELTREAYLAGATSGEPHAQATLEELLLLWVTSQNPAYEPIRPAISDAPLRERTAYERVVATVAAFFEQEPRFGADRQTLVDMLLVPARHAPDSLAAQLEYMRDHWGLLLDDPSLLRRLLLALDFAREEGKWLGRHAHGVGGDEDKAPRTYRVEGDSEHEAFSEDRGWMPRVVLMAKSTFVWLDQLSRAHGRHVGTLADIPDEELDALARRGFTGLWLIGLWRRSRASARIKHLAGNPDAVASAYSLHEYEIAEELGGAAAYENLKQRAAQRGIRLASDMVPNHMGIDSRWVIEHPHWFVQSDHPPFPGYRFDGPDLSDDGRVGLQVEDGYWSRTDAAVVFKRWDRATGDAKYIYHGNDGTSMPWNDTAQLDYTKAEVREAVIQTILHVARMFPIIRFDAAMTLAKRHYQRLWFPLPGHGGDIPSRARWAMTKEEFDAAIPVEFWREVVDRVAREVPDTLLLAEAFWMMEGYFVRTLGMHRVYNSAFMNMLKREDNANYRTTIKNVLEYDPRILYRFVNFMNNPDEDTAIAQFGDGDKYFGVATLMATMPGLPMFGHGQVEGFTEKYGMEFRRARWQETPNVGLVERHEREIFPLLRKRSVFSGVSEFTLYDLFSPEGWVDEDVFAYSNRDGDQRALVIVHNRYKETRGWIRTSVGFRGAHGEVRQRTLGEGLGVSNDEGAMLVMRDAVSGLEYLRDGRELCTRGIYVELGAFQRHVFWEMREVRDSEALPYRELMGELGGRGVPSIDEALLELLDRPVHAPLLEVLATGKDDGLRAFLEEGARRSGPTAAPRVEARVARVSSMIAMLPREHRGAMHGKDAHGMHDEDDAAHGADAGAARGPRDERAASDARTLEARAAAAAAWAACGALADDAESPRRFEELRLGRAVARALRSYGIDEARADRLASTVGALLASRPKLAPDDVVRALLPTEAGQRALGVNTWAGVTYVRREALEDAFGVAALCATMTATSWSAASAGAILAQAERAGWERDRIAELLSA
jgi:glycosidase